MSCRHFGLLDPIVRRLYAELPGDQTSFTALMILRVRRPGASISNYLPNYVFGFLCLYAAMPFVVCVLSIARSARTYAGTPNEKNKALAQFDGMKNVPRLMPVALICFVLWSFMCLNTLAFHWLFFQSSMPLFSSAVYTLLNATTIDTERKGKPPGHRALQTQPSANPGRLE
jgi:hypothetical protein